MHPPQARRILAVKRPCLYGWWFPAAPAAKVHKMYRVSNFIRHFARALLGGAAVATLWVNLDPASYYDVMETRVLKLALPEWLLPGMTRVTPITLVSEALMALFVFLLGKELWEANMLERGALHGRRAGLPFLATVGAVLGGVLVWTLTASLIETAEEASFATGWAVPVGGDAVLAYVVGRRIFGKGSPALHLVLLVAIGADLAGLLAMIPTLSLAPARLLWLALPALACGLVWWGFGRHAQARTERARQEALHLWPYVLAGAASWFGVMASGLPGALGLLPVIPVIPHAQRAFGLFAEAEEFLHDPLNRLAHLAVKPLLVVLFLFGLTRGGVDLMGFAPTTLVTLAAFWIGRPAGFLAGVALARSMGFGLPAGLSRGDLARMAALLALGFTTPVLVLGSALPGGAMAEAARMGLAITLLIAPALLLLARPRKP